MAKKQTFKKGKPHAKTILIFVVSAFVFFTLLSSVIENARKYWIAKGKLSELETQKENLNAKMKDISAENAYLSSPEGQEKIIREKYRLVKPGEGLIVITNDDKNDNLDLKRKTNKVGQFWDSILRGLGIRH